MDGALLGSVDTAIRKAKTAVLFQMPTEELGAASQVKILFITVMSFWSDKSEQNSK